MRFRISGFVSAVFLSAFLAGCGGGSSSNNNPTPPATLTITTTSPLTPGMVGSAYTASLAASGGTAPYTWTLASGTLPAGVSLSGSTIAGTPTTAGTSTFTLQVSDSESTPQTATLSATLVIAAPLAITTPSPLPAGTVGVAYSQTLAASGGTSPYTWSVDALPAGLTLSSDGALSGTPTGPSQSSPNFTVTDSASHTASLKLSLLVNPAPGTIADGTYSFLFLGTGPQGAASNAVILNGTFTAKSGKVLAGFYDENNNSGAAAALEQPISGGTLTNGTDGLGQLVLNVANNATMTFALATPASAGVGKDSDIRMIEFDDSTGAGTRGSGVLKPATATSTAGAIQGNFAFLLSGSDPNEKGQALIGSFQTDGAGNVTGGLADSNQAGKLVAYPQVFGTYAVDANGHGTFGVILGAGTIEQNTIYHYSFYQVSPGEWLMISIDPVTDASPLVGGTVLQQAAGPFTNASLQKGTSVLELNGLTPVSQGTGPDIILGLGSSDGNGNLSFNFDEYNATLSSNQSLTTTYTVDPATGRVPTSQSSGVGPTLYIIDSTRAFVLGFDSAASAGLLEAQTGSPFSNASFTGDYLGGSLPLVSTAVLNEAGLVSADGAGNLTMTTNRSTQQGLVSYQNVTGTYSVDSSGRAVVTAPDGLTRIFYVVSPNKVVYLTGDGGGYLGVFEK